MDNPDEPEVLEGYAGLVKVMVCVPDTWSDEQVIGFVDQNCAQGQTLFGFIACEDTGMREECPNREGFKHVVVGC